LEAQLGATGGIFSLRHTIITVLLAALAVGTWIYTWEPAATKRSRNVGADDQPLGYYLKGARLLGTDEEGRVAYRILAERLEELPARELLELAGVEIEYRPVDSQPWRMSANSATAPKDASQLDLVGSVELRNEPAPGDEPLLIATETLRFLPDTSSVESDQPVQIRIGDWQLDAIGIRTHLKGDTLELESKVHGRFSP
jgi:LPS export ABC transporter protein LptC